MNFQDRTQLCPVGSKQIEIKYVNLFSNQSGYTWVRFYGLICKQSYKELELAMNVMTSKGII